MKGYGLRAAAMATVCVLTTSCETPYSAPKQVDATRPTVTYKYRNDDELMQANDRASAFCTQYQSVPRTADFGNDPGSGGRYVVFECLATLPPSDQRAYDPNAALTVRSDRELMDAARDAQAYCRQNEASAHAVARVSYAPDGTKTVRFECRPS